MTPVSAAGSGALGGLRVCITRPQAQQRSWRRALEAAGAATLSLPLLSIEPLRDSAALNRLKALIMDLDHYQIGIFVSRNAVQQALYWIDQYWPQAPLGIDYFAVGEATARALLEDGVVAHSAQQAMNSEALLALPALQRVAGSKVVIFRGLGGRTLLAEKLRARGAQVSYCELYRRCLPEAAAAQLSHSDLGAAAGDMISVHSGETLLNLDRVITATGRPQLRRLPLLVPGQRVAALGREKGFAELISAENATDAAMLSALAAWQAQRANVD